jgi:phytoene desaturase
VKRILVENRKAVGVELESGDKVHADYVVLNADFARAMHTLVDPKHLRTWTPENLARKKFSCSTFMIYLGVNKRYDIPHHSICFANDYKKNIEEIAVHKSLPEDPSVYVQNACVTDPTLAPEGQSTLYLLVPIANCSSGIDWEKETPAFREKVLDLAEQRAGLTGLRDHIIEEQIITPDGWWYDKDVHLGATFNLAHNIGQMLFYRPRNRFEEFENCYLVGGGTHPGSGLPTILESARISSELILRRDRQNLE